MDTKNGRDNSPPEGEKPIIDQMTDLAAQAAGSPAETAVKAGAKKQKKRWLGDFQGRSRKQRRQ
jgi:hypothetical protein